MDKRELDEMLERWAQATAPDFPTIQFLQSRVRSGLEHRSPCPLDGDPDWIESPRWLWCLSRVACALLLTALGCWLFAGKASDSTSVSASNECRNSFCGNQDGRAVDGDGARLESLTAQSPISCAMAAAKELHPLKGEISDPNASQCLSLAQHLRGQLIFQQVCQMPGLAGPYRPDAFLLVAIPPSELEWMTLTSVIWRAVVQAN